MISFILPHANDSSLKTNANSRKKKPKSQIALSAP